MSASTASESSCALCGRTLGPWEPNYPVRFDDADADVTVCVACALILSRDDIGAWQRAPGRDPRAAHVAAVVDEARAERPGAG